CTHARALARRRPSCLPYAVQRQAGAPGLGALGFTGTLGRGCLCRQQAFVEGLTQQRPRYHAPVAARGRGEAAQQRGVAHQTVGGLIATRKVLIVRTASSFSLPSHRTATSAPTGARPRPRSNFGECHAKRSSSCPSLKLWTRTGTISPVFWSGTKTSDMPR